jgi:hypothetical protein
MQEKEAHRRGRQEVQEEAVTWRNRANTRPMRGVGLVAVTALTALALATSAEGASVTPSSQDYGPQEVATTGPATSFTLTTSASTQGVCVLHVIPDDPTSPCAQYIYNQYTTSTSALGGGPGATSTVGDFSVHNIDCPQAGMMSPFGVPASMSCHFEASFAPVAGGARSQTLTFTDTAGPTATATLSLTGTGIAPATALPAPAPITTTTTTTTTKRKKCKKKHRAAAAAKKKCKKRKR